jgi:hypothetical protein
MKRLLLLPLALGVSTVGLLAVPYQVGAHVVPSEDTPRIAAARCTVAKGRIANMTDTMRMVSERRTATYVATQEKVSARVTVLKQKGYDTTKLANDLQTINQQIQGHRLEADELHSAFSNLQNTACGDSDGAFAGALTDARTQLRTVRESSQTIHQTFREVIIPDIKAAATWLKEN